MSSQVAQQTLSSSLRSKATGPTICMASPVQRMKLWHSASIRPAAKKGASETARMDGRLLITAGSPGRTPTRCRSASLLCRLSQMGYDGALFGIYLGCALPFPWDTDLTSPRLAPAEQGLLCFPPSRNSPLEPTV